MMCPSGGTSGGKLCLAGASTMHGSPTYPCMRIQETFVALLRCKKSPWGSPFGPVLSCCCVEMLDLLVLKGEDTFRWVRGGCVHLVAPLEAGCLGGASTMHGSHTYPCMRIQETFVALLRCKKSPWGSPDGPTWAYVGEKSGERTG